MSQHPIERLKEKEENFLYDHPWLRNILSNGFLVIISSISAMVFALGFNCFMDPGADVLAGYKDAYALASGGVSGVGQVIVLFFELCGWKDIDVSTAISILYFVVNVPLIILGFLRVGRKFTLFTLINVAETSLFLHLFTPANIAALGEVFRLVNTNGGMLARALFGGVFTGLSSALAFKFDFSTGGIDIIAYYIALKKSALVGKYALILNCTTMTLFAFLTSANAGFQSETTFLAFARILYSALYLLASSLVVDKINLRNKKLKVEITTAKEGLGSLLVAQLPHGATVVNASGAYSGKPVFYVTMVVSSYEVNHLIKIVRKNDPHAFVYVTELQLVDGRFHMKPVK